MASPVPAFARRCKACTSFTWTDQLRRSGVRTSTDGKGWLLDNIFVERLWRSLKYQCVYLEPLETELEAKAGAGKWIEFYNRKRPIPPLAENPQPWSIG